MKRRLFLKGAGVVTVVVAGGCVWRAYDRGVFSVGGGPAFEPWEEWQETKDGPLALVRAAILAANPHNTQAWMFRATNSSIELFLDTKRNVGPLDPYLREQHIGMGCALENLMLAAAVNGYSASATLLPGKLAVIPVDAKLKPVAKVDLAAGQKQQSELYDAIPHRHTNRNPYHLEPLPSDFVDSILQLVNDESDVKLFLFTADMDRTHIVDMISKASDVVYGDPQIAQASERWIRTTWSDVQKFRDGLIVDEFGEPPLTAAVRKVTAPSLRKFILRHGLVPTVSYVEVLRATPVFGLIAVRDRYDQELNIRAGRIWQRAHLLATARGVAGRPVNEMVELVDYQNLRNQEPQASVALSGLTGDKNWQPTFMFCLGYPVREVSASPRRPLNDVLL
jgi:nitroreductase